LHGRSVSDRRSALHGIASDSSSRRPWSWVAVRSQGGQMVSLLRAGLRTFEPIASSACLRGPSGASKTSWAYPCGAGAGYGSAPSSAHRCCKIDEGLTYISLIQSTELFSEDNRLPDRLADVTSVVVRRPERWLVV
jgi:hypothetical protein